MKAWERNGVELCNQPITEDDTEESKVRKAADHDLLKTLVLLELKRQLYANDKGLADVNLPEPTEDEEAAGPTDLLGSVGTRRRPFTRACC